MTLFILLNEKLEYFPKIFSNKTFFKLHSSNLAPTSLQFMNCVLCILPPTNETLDKSQFLNTVSIISTLSKLQSIKVMLLKIQLSTVIPTSFLLSISVFSISLF